MGVVKIHCVQENANSILSSTCRLVFAPGKTCAVVRVLGESRATLVDPFPVVESKLTDFTPIYLFTLECA